MIIMEEYISSISLIKKPNEIGGFGGEGYTHDAQVVNYIGPDSDYSGKEIFVGSKRVNLFLLTLVIKKIQLQFLQWNMKMCIHSSGWFTEDQRFFILGDEADEIQRGGNTRTIIIDVAV